MRVFRQLQEVPPDFGPSALTIGNFDGVHLGHRQILHRVREVAAERELRPSVLTFDPHPTRIVAPERAPLLMTSVEERCRLMEREGIDQALILPFTDEIAQLSPEEFVRRLLVDKLGVRSVMVGGNFRFGRGQAGNVEVLQALGGRFGFDTGIVPPITYRKRAVSSSAVREAVRGGNVSLAARFLGRPYALEGAVVSGRGVGSKQTVPTLNLSTSCAVIPATGVYVTRTFDGGSPRQWRSITNIGFRPTFGASDELTIETFLLDTFDGSTPERIRLEFLWRVRGERTFASPEALKQQILRDVARAQAWFRRTALWTNTR